MLKTYRYVGWSSIRDNLPKISNRHHVISSDLVKVWLTKTKQPKNPDDTITVTFIVDTDNRLWINDRHSEHVLCADGGEVLSAGEMTFEIIDTQVEIVSVTNQSTGYCPEPDTYSAVRRILSKTNISHPLQLTTAYQFRRCDECETTNIIKDDWFVCGVCDADLNNEWNYG